MLLLFFALTLFVACVEPVVADTASSPQPVTVSSFCRNEISRTSACTWTADCDVGGCQNKCITNRSVGQSFYVLLDRAFSEESYSACPQLAYFLTIVRQSQNSRRRSLLSEDQTAEATREILEFMKRDALWIESLQEKHSRLSRQDDIDSRNHGRSTLSLLAGNPTAPSPGLAAASLGNLPSNPCPTLEDIDEFSTALRGLAARWADVFATAARGEALSADQSGWEFITQEPNTYRLLTAFYQDPDRLAEYFTTNCMSEVIEAPKALEYLYWLTTDDRERLDANLTMVQCVDNFGAYERFDANYDVVLSQCYPPFGAAPDCFSVYGHYMVTSSSCATAYANMFNITDATPLANVAAQLQAIQDACSAVSSEEQCKIASTNAIDKIEEYHDSIPLKNADAVEEPPAVGPVDPVGPVCIPDCANAPPPNIPESAPPPMGRSGLAGGDGGMLGDAADANNTGNGEFDGSVDEGDTPEEVEELTEADIKRSAGHRTVRIASTVAAATIIVPMLII